MYLCRLAKKAARDVDAGAPSSEAHVLITKRVLAVVPHADHAAVERAIECHKALGGQAVLEAVVDELLSPNQKKCPQVAEAEGGGDNFLFSSSAAPAAKTKQFPQEEAPAVAAASAKKRKKKWEKIKPNAGAALGAAHVLATDDKANKQMTKNTAHLAERVGGGGRGGGGAGNNEQVAADAAGTLGLYDYCAGSGF